MELTLTRPDDWHIHLRDGGVLRHVVPHVARATARAIVMPNLLPPVTTTAEALEYRDRILEARPEASDFEPLMTLYLTDNTGAEEIARAKASGRVFGAKLYPAGATTNSDAGVTAIDRIDTVLEALQREGLPLLVHGEVTRREVDVFDREARFLEEVLEPLVSRFPDLKVVVEHITTREAVEFVRSGPERIAATITAHHLLCDRNDMLVGGIKPHFYCLPILKRRDHRLALIEAATSGHPRFFLGTDSAPHSQAAKEQACGCAGCYTGYAPIELYAEAFDRAGALDRLEAFASFHGPDFYGLPRNSDAITLRREAWTVPASYPLGDEAVIPFLAGETLQWKRV